MTARRRSKRLPWLACLLASPLWAAGPLPVPANGVYLGIWADPDLASGPESAIEIREGPAPLGISRTFALHLHYYAWTDLSDQLVNGVFQPDAALQGDIAHGRVPVISWACDDATPNSDHVIAGGDPSEDAVITATAKALAQYPGPVLLRWLWEFNVLVNHQTCRGDTGGTPTQQVYNDFIGAWQHIRTIFREQGADNVLFLWNPGDYSSDSDAKAPQRFYPGNDYVDWLGIDTYQRGPNETFDNDFGLFYSDFGNSQYGDKPLMVGENGAQNYGQHNSELQWTYLQGLLADVQANRYPLLKAYDYFDAPGNTPPGWVLDDNNGQGNGGLAAFAMLAASPSFSPTPVEQTAREIKSVTLYVAPGGNDAWSGRLDAPNGANTDGPFATFDHARQAVQSVNKTGLNHVSVQFRGGTYLLNKTINFTAADSGSANTGIVYENYPRETAVFSGGVRVENWINTGGNTWKATLPASTQYFENLFYNGVRRLRPRLGGYLGTYLRFAGPVYVSAQQTNCPVETSPGQWECFDRFQYNASDPIFATWKNLAPAASNPCKQPAGNPALAGDIEVLDWEQFSTPRLRVSCVDATNRIVYLTGPTGINRATPTQDGFIAGNRYLVENVQDELTQPGQWFLDRSTTPWTLTYLANPGENPNTDTVIAPQLPQLLIASNLQYVTFRGLTFEHDNYTVPAAGHPSEELEPDISAAVSFQNSQYLTFDAGTVAHTSGVGLEFISCINSTSPAWCVSNNLNAATAHDVIENSAFYDIGALAVRIGDPFVPADTDSNVPYSMTVENNVVGGYGRIIPASFGIGQGVGHDNLYTHNDVYDGYHCAISISMSSGDTVKPSGIGNANNTISFNHVYNLLQGIMNDGGSIRIEAGDEVYTAPGNKIYNNKIHDVTDASIMDSNGYGGNGIYLDNQTGLVDVENNLVYRVSGNTVYTPQGPAAPNEANIVKNNILAFGRQSMVAINFPYPYGVPTTPNQNFIVANNLFLFDRDNSSTPKFWVQGGCVYGGGFPYTQFQEWNSNMYWRTDGAFGSDNKAFEVQPDAVTGGNNAPCSGNTNNWKFYSFSGWQQTVGEDAGSLVQNPGFANPAYPADDFSLPHGSPGVGFVVFDICEPGAKRDNALTLAEWRAVATGPCAYMRSSPASELPVVPATFPTKTYNPATDY